MKHKTPPQPVTPPLSAQLTISLIQEELKARKLFSALTELGFDDSPYQPHLISIILRSIGLNEDDDHTFNTAYAIIKKRALKINPSHSSITKQALKAYHELLTCKKQLVI